MKVGALLSTEGYININLGILELSINNCYMYGKTIINI